MKGRPAIVYVVDRGRDMLITKPEINTPYWSAEGVRKRISGFFYQTALRPPTERGEVIDGEQPIFFIVDLLGKDDEPTVTLSHYILQVPDAVEIMQEWIAEHKLIDIWKQELAVYKDTLEQIDLPGVEPVCEDECSLLYPVFIEAPGEYDIPPLRFDVMVFYKDYITCALSLPSGDDGDPSYYLCTYDLDLPITIESLKASAKGPLLQYLRALEEGETC